MHRAVVSHMEAAWLRDVQEVPRDQHFAPLAHPAASWLLKLVSWALTEKVFLARARVSMLGR